MLVKKLKPFYKISYKRYQKFTSKEKNSRRGKKLIQQKIISPEAYKDKVTELRKSFFITKRKKYFVRKCCKAES